MSNTEREYWAIFSIYDYRTPRFRQALMLFDKVVISVPDGVCLRRYDLQSGTALT